METKDESTGNSSSDDDDKCAVPPKIHICKKPLIANSGMKKPIISGSQGVISMQLLNSNYYSTVAFTKPLFIVTNKSNSKSK
jgi:hypothetical protein